MGRRKTAATDETRDIVLMRAKFRCEICGSPLMQMSIHHRKPRRMGGTRDPEINSAANLMAVCGSGTTGCHGWLESHRAEAKEKGYLVSQWDEPSKVAVLILGQKFLYLDAEGGYLPNPT